jgi:menaquinone-dependent protoporphyrinogen IX oxidase
LKILILYDSKHGFTEHCLGLLAGNLPAGADLWPVASRPGVPVWSDYDAILFGGPVYFGRWAPRVTAFVERHATEVAARPSLGAFVVSLSPKAAALRYFSKTLPTTFKGRLGHVACFGGAIRWKDLSWWERLVVKRSRGFETDVGNLDLGSVQALADWVVSRG